MNTTHAHTDTCVHTHTDTHTLTQTQTHRHTHTHTHTHLLPSTSSDGFTKLTLVREGEEEKVDDDDDDEVVEEVEGCGCLNRATAEGGNDGALSTYVHVRSMYVCR